MKWSHDYRHRLHTKSIGGEIKRLHTVHESIPLLINVARSPSLHSLCTRRTSGHDL